MSFILDALRKSENKRKNQHDDGVRAVYDEPAQKPPKSRLWVIALVFVLLFNLFLVLWMVNVWQHPSADMPVVQIPTATQTAPTSAPQPRPEESVVAPASVSTEPVVPVSEVEQPVPVAPGEPVAAIETPSVEIPAIKPPVMPEVVIQIEPPPAAEPVVATRLNTIGELPATLRSRISTFQMALHAYNANNPAASMVQIDGRLLRTGGQIDEDLLLEEITVDGVVLRSGEYRFLVSRRGQ